VEKVLFVSWVGPAARKPVLCPMMDEDLVDLLHRELVQPHDPGLGSESRRASLPHHVPVVLDVVCQPIRLNVPETGILQVLPGLFLSPHRADERTYWPLSSAMTAWKHGNFS